MGVRRCRVSTTQPVCGVGHDHLGGVGRAPASRDRPRDRVAPRSRLQQRRQFIRVDECTGTHDSGFTCTSVPPFLRTYAACRAGTQSGDRIQDAVCHIDTGCITTTLDGTRCYAPASRSTPYAGFDITRTLPGYYWTLDSVRAVSGWTPNPALGPIPTMRLAYTRPTTTVATAEQ